MATNNLNLLYSIQVSIKDLEEQIKELKEQEQEITGKILSSGSFENRYYRLVTKTRAGDRVVQCHLLRESFPEIYKKVVVESVKVTDLKKFLGDEVISELSIKKPDSIKYLVEKKELNPVVVA